MSWLRTCAKVLLVHYKRGPGLSQFIVFQPCPAPLYPPSAHPSERACLRIRYTRSRYAPPRASRSDGLGGLASHRNYSRSRCTSSNRSRGGFPMALANPSERDTASYGSPWPSGSRLRHCLAPSQVPRLRERVRSLYPPINAIIDTKRRMAQDSDISIHELPRRGLLGN